MADAKHYFVTGTDTEVGKTFITCALLYAARSQGLRGLGLKPVAAGCEIVNGERVNDDALQIQSHAGIALSYPQINPVALEQPVAPHIAARNEGRDLNVAMLASHCRKVLKESHDLALVEGAGGWLVPLNEQETYADLAVSLKLEVILVVALRLGCINHALLSAESIRHKGLKLAGWVANQCSAEPMIEQEANLETLRQRIPGIFMGHVPRAQQPSDPSVQSALRVPW